MIPRRKNEWEQVDWGFAALLLCTVKAKKLSIFPRLETFLRVHPCPCRKFGKQSFDSNRASLDAYVYVHSESTGSITEKHKDFLDDIPSGIFPNFF